MSIKNSSQGLDIIFKEDYFLWQSLTQEVFYAHKATKQWPISNRLIALTLNNELIKRMIK